jgi:hypothetical protein
LHSFFSVPTRFSSFGLSISPLGEEDGLAYIKVELPFRKTEKFGGAIPLCLPTTLFIIKTS